jgi:hypothetical protein
MTLPPPLVRYHSQRDPVFGPLEFTEDEWTKVIQTPHFQAMREVKQLPMVDRYYPSAQHTRFEHMLLTAYLAGEMVYQLMRNQPSLEDVLDALDLSLSQLYELFRMAGLTHDWGHLCFSHAADDFLKGHEGVDLAFRGHEERSITLDKWALPSLEARYMELLCAMIRGKPIEGYPPWFFEVVANHYSELDVDKLAYISRDAHSTGLDRDLQIQRMFQHTRVAPDGHLVWDVSVAPLIVRVFSSRQSMHAEVYQHPQVVKWTWVARTVLKAVFEVMGVDALLNAGARDGDHRWRIVLTDSTVQGLLRMATGCPGWLRKMTYEEDEELCRAALWMVGGVGDQLRVVGNDATDDTNDLIVLDSEYTYANSEFHPADRVRLYSDPAHLDRTKPLRDLEPYQRLDLDLEHHGVKRTLMFRVPSGMLRQDG